MHKKVKEAQARGWSIVGMDNQRGRQDLYDADNGHYTVPDVMDMLDATNTLYVMGDSLEPYLPLKYEAFRSALAERDDIDVRAFPEVEFSRWRYRWGYGPKSSVKASEHGAQDAEIAYRIALETDVALKPLKPRTERPTRRIALRDAVNAELINQRRFEVREAYTTAIVQAAGLPNLVSLEPGHVWRWAFGKHEKMPVTQKDLNTNAPELAGVKVGEKVQRALKPKLNTERYNSTIVSDLATFARHCVEQGVEPSWSRFKKTVFSYKGLLRSDYMNLWRTHYNYYVGDDDNYVAKRNDSDANPLPFKAYERAVRDLLRAIAPVAHRVTVPWTEDYYMYKA